MRKNHREHLCGLYTITHILSGKVYVGMSSDIESRFKQHKRGLKKGTYKNKEMQALYNAEGIEGFRFEIIALTRFMPISEESELIHSLRVSGQPLFNQTVERGVYPPQLKRAHERKQLASQLKIKPQTLSRVLSLPVVNHTSAWPAILDALGLEIVIQHKGAK